MCRLVYCLVGLYPTRILVFLCNPMVASVKFTNECNLSSSFIKTHTVPPEIPFQ
jgi:hypothetical protein